MGTPLNRFNVLAKYYDALARLVFGRSIRKAQLVYLTEIPSRADVLILGGGTGYLLEQLMMVHPDCRVWYVEASSSMIQQAGERTRCFHERITFIHGTENDIPSQIRFDVVILDFFLDLFNESTVQALVMRMRQSTKPGGIWLVTDFTKTGKWWHAVLLTLMYRFFGALCGIEARTLPPWEAVLAQNELAPVQERYFYGRFIKREVWKKITG
jgi:ubiquinone/menaquinone biosynthesis C-methylase UbiE